MSRGAGLERLAVVVAGHVDHGKSTVVGHLLARTGVLPKGRVEQVQAECQRLARPFEWAFLLDALKDERAQGITIDAARVFFQSARREYVVIDAPGHAEFLRNLVSGASRADAALLVLDARAGLEESARRHAALLPLLGVTQVVVLVNKMDLVGRDEAVFARLAREVRAFCESAGFTPRAVIPVSGRDGDNLAARSADMPWYDGPTVLAALDAFRTPTRPVDAPLRLWVQDVYRFTEAGDDRRIVAGTVESGRLAAGDDVVFFPSGKRARVASLEAFPGAAPAQVEAGQATGFTLAQPVYVPRGELVTKAGEAAPKVTARVRGTTLWLGPRPLTKESALHLRVGTTRVGAKLERVHRVVETGDLSVKERAQVERGEVADCTFHLERAIASDVDTALPDTARFVLVEDFDVRGGGLLREALDDSQAQAREAVWRRNQKWEPSAISLEARTLRTHQRPGALVLTGPPPHDRKALARALEARLFARGHAAYFLGIANVLYGVDADLPRDPSHRLEHLRRLSEVAHLLVDSGQLLLVTAAELTRAEVELLRTALSPWPVEVAWLGDAVTTDATPDVQLLPRAGREAHVATLERRLEDAGLLLPARGAPGGEAASLVGGRTTDQEDAGALRARATLEGQVKSAAGGTMKSSRDAGVPHASATTAEPACSPPPAKFGRADAEAAPSAGPAAPPGRVVWLTGLPGSGKSTVAKAVVAHLQARGRRVEHLDGDALRTLVPGAGFTREERDAHVRRVGHLASRLEAHGVTVVASLVSPYEDSRRFVRSLCARFFEVHVATPLEECERRDPKGLYAKARAGVVTHFTGVSDPYEAPPAPDLVLDTSKGTVEDAAAAVLALLGEMT
ncbi:MAG: adenylyl-sulfate kinase [Myxococcota bacterium]